jgi:hypothetical protein
MNALTRFLLLAALFLLAKTADVIGSEILLRDNLAKAVPGDFIVTAQNKSYTMLLVREKVNNYLMIEEINVPVSRIQRGSYFSWRRWIEEGASGHTGWVMYPINLNTGEMQEAFSFTKKEWYTIPKAQNFLSTLLNLRLKHISKEERKKVGPPPNSGSPDWRPLWQPRMVVNGQTIPGVTFDAWRTRWPKDGSELSGRLIEVYVPQEDNKYPAYFPYWLQIHGMVGKAKIRIIDSGTKLFSSAKLEENFSR